MEQLTVAAGQVVVQVKILHVASDPQKHEVKNLQVAENLLRLFNPRDVSASVEATPAGKHLSR